MFFELSQYADIALLLLRMAVAAVFIVHALPKLKNAAAMGQALGWPAAAVFVLGTVELLASVGLITGIFFPLAAFLLALVMIGALYFKIAKWNTPFTARDKTGWEFDLILLAANIFLAVNGGGALGIW